MLSGYKTYLTALAMLAVGIGGAWLGEHDANKALEYILEALALAGLRHGVATGLLGKKGE